MIETSATVAKLFDAFHKAQGEMSGVLKDKANAHFKTRYATLESVMNTARPVLNAHGLSWTQAPGAVVDGRLTITTQIMHVSGEWMRSTFHMAVAKQDPQGIGSACTYGLRYSLMAVLGLPPTDDDDGESAMDRRPHSLSSAASPAAAAEPPVKSAYKARKEGDWPPLERGLRACRTPDELKQWGLAHREQIHALPTNWQFELTELYETQMAELKMAMAGSP
jgi:hypothetical protein